MGFSYFLNESGFQPLPSPEELHKFQEERRAAATRVIAEEREAALEAQQKEEEREKDREKEREKKDKEFSFREKDEDKETLKEGMFESVGRVKEAFKQHSRNPSWPFNRDRAGTNESSDSAASGGWKPSTVDQTEVLASSADPMIQQMTIIQNYIDQARQAKKWDEVNMLEANLRDLKMEYNQVMSGGRR